MPSAAKVSWAQLRVGIMAVVAIAILGVLIFLLTGSGNIFEGSFKLRTYMSDSAAMATGSPVRLNGILIGNISSINLTGSREPERVVVIEMEIQDKYLTQIPEDSIAGVSAANLLGDKFINITKGKSTQHVREGGTLEALQAQDIPELMARAGDLLGSVQVMLKRLDSMLAEIEAGRGNIGKLLRDEALYEGMKKTLADAQTAVQRIYSGDGTLAKLLNEDDLYQEIRKPILKIDTILAGIEAGQGTAGKLLKDEQLYVELRQTVAEVRKVVEDLNAGRGTAGKLLKDDTLYRNLNQTVAKLEGTIDKVNSGQGTMGQLLVNPQLYESLHGATNEAQSLLKDIRANPKKFLRVKLAIF